MRLSHLAVKPFPDHLRDDPLWVILGHGDEVESAVWAHQALSKTPVGLRSAHTEDGRRNTALTGNSSNTRLVTCIPSIPPAQVAPTPATRCVNSTSSPSVGT